MALLPCRNCAHVNVQAAGAAFGVLFKGGAGSAVDNIIPSLLVSLEGGPQQASQALEGLRVILSVRPQALGVIVPKLLKPPLNSTSVTAIGSLSEVAGTDQTLSVRHQQAALQRLC